MIKNFRPKIKVHSWGGFGSQLNALSLAFDLKIKFPKRNIEILIRTGGIHNAAYELDSLLISEFQISTSEIQQSNIKAIKRFPYFIVFFKEVIIKRLLFRSGIYSRCNSRMEIDSLKHWIIATRGSYNFYPSDNFIEFLLKKIKVNENNFEEKLCCIHYRLGDLLNLESKAPTDQRLLIEQIEQIDYMKKGIKYLVMTSDPEIALTRLGHANLNLMAVYADPIQLIRQGINCGSFLGTSSKISVWIVFIRLYLGLGQNYLPMDCSIFFDNVMNLEYRNKINFY